MSDAKKSVLSATVQVSKLPQEGRTIRLEPDQDVLFKLAREHDLIEIHSFLVEATVRAWRKGGAQLQGQLVAEVSQSCVVTGEPVRNRIVETMDVQFMPASSRISSRRAFDDERYDDPLGPDPPEIFENDRIDIGAVVEEFLELALDPYPRKEGAKIPPEFAANEVETEKTSPFAKLSKLKNRH